MSESLTGCLLVIEELERERDNLRAVCIRAEEYFRGLKNTENMQGPEYGIWHNIKQALNA